MGRVTWPELPPRKKLAIILGGIECGLTDIEIARVNGVTVQTIQYYKKHYHIKNPNNPGRGGLQNPWQAREARKIQSYERRYSEAEPLDFEATDLNLLRKEDFA